MKNMDGIIKNADEMFEKYNFTEAIRKHIKNWLDIHCSGC